MRSKTPHILNASTNLVGFCFFVLVSIKQLGLPRKTFLDEAVAFSILLFIVSALVSFLSIRNTSDSKGARFETIADYIFVVGLFSLFIITSALFLDYL